FVRWSDWRQLASIAAACGIAALLLLPIAMGYSRIHWYYGFSRSLDEVMTYSAGLASLISASPLLAFWGWLGEWAHPEADLFPGLTITALALVGGLLAWRANRDLRDEGDRLSFGLLLAALASAALAACGWMFAPWSIDLPGFSASAETPYKPLTVAVIMF